MKISYKRLWKLLIDRDISKGKFRELTGISSSTSAKLLHGEIVSTEILLRICEKLNCRIEEIMEIVPNRENENIEIK